MLIRRAWIAAFAGAIAGWAAVLPAATAQTWSDVVKAAEKEGRVVVIGPPTQPHRLTLGLFEKAYPKIKLELTGMVPTQYEPRVAAERKAEKFLVDIVISGVSSTIYEQQIPAGWYDPIRDVIRPELARDELWLGGFDSSFLDKGRKYVFAFGASVSEGIYVNRQFVKESEFNKVSDLLKPELRGKIAWDDPRGRGSGSYTLTKIMFDLGEPATRRLLETQEIAVTSTPRQLAEWAVRGNYPIVIGVAANLIAEFQAQGIGKELVPIVEPPAKRTVTPAWGGMLLFNKAPNPNAAKVFVNWLLSEEAQSDWAERGQTNSRRIGARKGRADLAADAETWLKGLNLNREENSEARVKAMSLAREALK